MPDPAKELVDVLDDNGDVIGTATRETMRAWKLAHRCVYLLVLNRSGELFIHLRTAAKDIYPSYWDVTVGGVPMAGESFDDAAWREGSEELGVEVGPEALFPFRYDEAGSVVHGMVYHVLHDGPFQLQAEEIVRGEFVTLAEARRKAASEQFCPDGLAVLAEYERRLAL